MKNVLEKIFGSRMRAKLLGWFFTHEEEVFFVRQIALILKEDPTNLSREMAKLEDLGIFISRREGNLKQFCVNRNCSFFKEMKGLVTKTVGIAGGIKEERRFHHGCAVKREGDPDRKRRRICRGLKPWE